MMVYDGLKWFMVVYNGLLNNTKPHQTKKRGHFCPLNMFKLQCLFGEFLDSCTHLLAFFILTGLVVQFLQNLKNLQIVWLD